VYIRGFGAFEAWLKNDPDYFFVRFTPIKKDDLVVVPAVVPMLLDALRNSTALIAGKWS